MRAEHVDVVELGQLVGGECFRGAERHVAGVVDDDVEPSIVGDDLGNRGIYRGARRHVEFDGAKRDAVFRFAALRATGLRRKSFTGRSSRMLSEALRPRRKRARAP